MKLSKEKINLDEIVEAIKTEVDREKIILFGSRATSNFSSDIDLIIIERLAELDLKMRRDQIKKIREALADFRISKDILVYSKNELEEWKDSLNHIIGRSLREGKILYERL